jgi:iron complex outermembrane recepter protein
MQNKNDITQQEIEMGNFKKRPVVIALLGVMGMYAQSAAHAQAVDTDQIVVTANKVSQSALKVGASLSAISADDIREKGVTDAKSLTDLMPNTQISQAGNSSVVVNIRGIENTNTTAMGEPAAAFHIDGVYLGRMSGAGSAFYDIERVEVLRGPQGTLYGRNANAGVVNVITKAPSDRQEGALSVDLGNLGQQRVDGMFNLPVNEALALRAAFSTNRRDGFSQTKTSSNGFTENQDNIHVDSVRLQARVKFSSQTSLNVSYDESTNKTTGPNYYNLTTGGIPTKLVDSSLLMQGKFNDKISGLKTELKTDVGFANLNYIYGNRTTKNKEDYSTGPLVMLTKFKMEQESHEIRLSSNEAKSPLQWVAGYYRFKETGTDGQLDGNAPFYLFGPTAPGPAPFGPSQCGGLSACYPGLQYKDRLLTNQSEAFFGQLTYSLDETSRVIAGARRTEDKKLRDYGTQIFAFNGLNYDGNPAATLYGKAAWTSSTYKLGYEKDLSPSQMFYTSVSTGFKAGGFNDGDTRVNPSLIYKPEQITAYEAGLNGKFLDNSLQLTTSIFHYDYTDMQKSAVVNAEMLTLNTGSATVDGAELSARYRVSTAGRIDASLGLLAAKYKDYTTPNGTNYGGVKLDKTPSYTLNLGYAHNWNLETGARLTGYVGTKYSSSYVTTDTGTPTVAPTQFTQKGFTKSNASLTYVTPDDKVDVQFYVKNIENKSQLMGSVAFFGANYGYMSEPRTLGVRSIYRF